MKSSFLIFSSKAWSISLLLFSLRLFVTLWTTACQASLSLSPGVCSNLCPLSQWCYLTISSSATLFSFCLHSCPASGSFPMSWQFASGGQNIRASASASALPMTIQGWFPLGLTGFISLQSKGLSRVFSSTTIQKHHFFSTWPSLGSNSHIHTWLLEKTIALTRWTFVGKCLCFLTCCLGFAVLLPIAVLLPVAV